MQILTDDESQLVHDFIFTEWARKVLEQDLQKVGVFKYPEIYKELIEEALRRLSLDMRDLKQKMNKHGIKIYDRQVKKLESGNVIRYKVTSRGIHDEVSYMDHVVRNNTREYVKKYLKPY